MTRTKALVNNLLMSNLQWKSNLDNKSRTIEIVILNTKWKDCKSRKNLCTKNFTYTKKFYVHEIAAVNLSKIFFLKNAKKTCKPNNRDLNHDWIRKLRQKTKQNSFPFSKSRNIQIQTWSSFLVFQVVCDLVLKCF